MILNKRNDVAVGKKEPAAMFLYGKALDEDWPRNCTTKTVDAMAFVNKMQAIKTGQPVDWKCPFCGGNVVLMKNEDGHTIIGCEECDMRINLESN